MKKMLVVLLAIFLCSVTAEFAYSQSDINFDMEQFWGPTKEPISEMTPQEIEKANNNLNDAVEPIIDLFGFMSGGGLYNTADMHGVLGFDAGVKLVAMRVGDDQLPFLDGLQQDLQEGPLQGESVVPIPMLHASVGVLPNLEVMGRFITYPMGEEEDGNVTLIGLGAKYGLLQNFALPKVAIVGAYHYLTVPESFDFGSINSLSGALVVSKAFPIITLYAGAGVDYTTLELDLPDPIPDPDPFNKTNFRGNVGFKLSPIPFVYLNVDYNFGAVEGVSAGLGISMR